MNESDRDRDRLLRMELGIERIEAAIGDDTKGMIWRMNGHSKRLGLVEKFVGTVTTLALVFGFVGYMVRDIFVEWVKHRMTAGN